MKEFSETDRLDLLDETIRVWKEAVIAGGKKPGWAGKRYLNGCPFCEAILNYRLTCATCYLREVNPIENCGLKSYCIWENHKTTATAKAVLNELLTIKKRWCYSYER